MTIDDNIALVQKLVKAIRHLDDSIYYWAGHVPKHIMEDKGMEYEEDRAVANVAITKAEAWLHQEGKASEGVGEVSETAQLFSQQLAQQGKRAKWVNEVEELKPCPYASFTNNDGASFILKTYDGYSDFVLFEDGKPSRCFRFTTTTSQQEARGE